jgi:hypothetical protein
MEINYCRREIALDEKTRLLCMNRITTKNALEWCERCREKLPLWPANDLIPAVLHPEVS